MLFLLLFLTSISKTFQLEKFIFSCAIIAGIVIKASLEKRYINQRGVVVHELKNEYFEAENVNRDNFNKLLYLPCTIYNYVYESSYSVCVRGFSMVVK